MPYEKELYDRVLAMYEQDRHRARHERAARLAAAYQSCPDLKDIDMELDRTASAIAQKILVDPMQSAAMVKQLEQNIHTLTTRRANILKNAGFSEEYTDLQYRCKLCDDTGYIHNTPCECMKKHLTAAAYDHSDLKGLIGTHSFDTFDLSLYSDAVLPQEGISPRERMQDILRVCLKFVNEFDTAKDNLLFFGGVGIGKTFLSSAIAREMLAKGKSVMYQSSGALFSLYGDYKFGRISPAEAKPKLDRLAECDLLIIDDLGTEAVSNITVAYLFELFNGRILAGKKMIISTNLSINELADTYSERFHSRLFEHFAILKFIGEDIRFKKLRER